MPFNFRFNELEKRWERVKKTKQQQIDDLWKRLEDKERDWLREVDRIGGERDRVRQDYQILMRDHLGTLTLNKDLSRDVENLREALNVMTEKQLETRATLRSKS